MNQSVDFLLFILHRSSVFSLKWSIRTNDHSDVQSDMKTSRMRNNEKEIVKKESSRRNCLIGKQWCKTKAWDKKHALSLSSFFSLGSAVLDRLQKVRTGRKMVFQFFSFDSTDDLSQIGKNERKWEMTAIFVIFPFSYRSGRSFHFEKQCK